MKFAIFAAFLVIFVTVTEGVPTCPIPEGEFVTLFPHATDCTKFWKCERGIPVEMDCPVFNRETGERLNFDAVKLLCEWPHLARCFSA